MAFIGHERIDIEDTQIRKVLLDTVCLSTNHIIPTQYRNTHLRILDDIPKFSEGLGKQLVFQLDAYIAKHKLDEVKVPRDWWQHFKLRWFPERLLAKYPVKYTIYDFEALYPLIQIPEEKAQIMVYVREGGIL